MFFVTLCKPSAFFVLFFYLLFPIQNVKPQEYILDAYNLKTNNSIVRETGDGLSIIANCYHGWKCFYILDGQNISTFTPKYFDQPVHVYDFEVLYDEYVYFCGEIDNGANSNAVLGYFKINDFLSTAIGSNFNVQLMSNPNLIYYNKLELLPVDDGIHVIMTGKNNNGYGCVTDAYANTYTPSNWQTYTEFINDGRHDYDDVAITDHYVIITSRKNSRGYIQYFKNPTSATSHIVQFNKYSISYDIKGPILIEHCESDAFVTGAYSPNENGVVFSGFNSNACLHSLTVHNVSSIDPDKQLRDIKYNNYSQTLDALLCFLNGLDTASIILHLDQTLTNGNMANTHEYNDEILSSLYCSSFNPNQTIASGQRNDEDFPHILSLYSHILGEYNGCTLHPDRKYYSFLHTLAPFDAHIGKEYYNYAVAPKSCGVSGGWIINRCISK